MNVATIGIAGLRAAAMALELLGRPKVSRGLDTLADAAEAGVNVDQHMAVVAQLLKDRKVEEADWTDVQGRIAADSAALQAVKTS